MVPLSATSLTRDAQINGHVYSLLEQEGKQMRCFGGIEDVLEDVTERYD
jgi:hypothetical protein